MKWTPWLTEKTITTTIARNNTTLINETNAMLVLSSFLGGGWFGWLDENDDGLIDFGFATSADERDGVVCVDSDNNGLSISEETNNKSNLVFMLQIG